jgi:glycosyltransferase involved in cell wall biosynthesis
VNLPDLRLKDNDHGRVEVLFLGLVGRRKGIYDLLEAFKEALNQVPEIHLTVGGNGEVEKARLLADNLEINKNITFAGWVGGEQKEHLLKRASFYVLPSYNEGLPVSLLEAMSWNMPVISTRVGGIPELVDHGIDGFLIDAGDQKSLSESIALLARNEKLRQQMGDNARRKIENNFSREVVLPELENLYQSLTVSR